MRDKIFLTWIHERLVNVHGESELYDYMHKLRAIIADCPPEKETLPLDTGNCLSDILPKEEAMKR